MKIRFFFILSLSLLFAASPAFGEWQIRPVTGIGVLIVRNFNPDDSRTPPVLTLYREPGVGRIGERPVVEIPLLKSIFPVPAGEHPVAVIGKRGEWLLIAYDDAGREGWVRMARWWGYEGWDDLLKGRIVYLLPGIPKERYSLYAEPSATSPPTAELTVDEPLGVAEVREESIHIVTAAGVSGWISWMDGNGRFLVRIGEKISQQKH